MLITSSGCSYEVISRKFIRKKKKKGVTEIYHTGGYKKQPNATLYKNYYLYWKAWEDDLVNYLGQFGHTKMRNNLKLRRSSKEAISNLKLMQSYLIQEKAEELTPYIKELEKTAALFEEQDLSDAVATKVKYDIEKHKRTVQRQFDYSSAKKYILPDEKPKDLEEDEAQ